MSAGRPALRLVLVPLVALAQLDVDRRFGSYRAQQEALYLSSGDELKQLAPTFEDIAADLYWLRTVQYYGGVRAFNTGGRFELLWPLIDITTTLDPRLEIAYRYGAIFLSEPWPIGAGEPARGVQILEKGIRLNPRSWRLRWDLGNLWHFFIKDDHRAAQVLVEASKVPGAPYWLESLAGAMLLKSDREVSREIWKHQYEMAEGAIKENALYHLQQLDVLDLRDALKKVADDFSKRNDRFPGSWDELIRAGALRGVPSDPTGVPMDYDPATGMASVSRKSRLWRPEP